MNQEIKIKRTTSNDPDFQMLVAHLDHELWNELNEDQATYDQYNKVPDLPTVILLYAGDRAVACGCFKKYDSNTVEIKRMFVEKDHRGKGLSKIILDELEKWAAESGFQYSILETSIHFKVAQTLYANAGYSVIENYDQYKGLEESVCMKKELNPQPLKGRNETAAIDDEMTSALRKIKGIEHFDFENDFVEHNIRCIPMIVRFKMDRAGIKLKLTEWSKFNIEERTALAKKPCNNEEESKEYNNYLSGLVKSRTGNEATSLEFEHRPGWSNINAVPEVVIEKAREFGVSVSVKQWQELSNLQRFTLIKLTRPGHESKNFVKAIKEFGLLTKVAI
jgi:putative acetyltransferase